VLRIDIDSEIRPSCEEIFEQWDGSDTIDAGTGNFRPRQLCNEAGPISDSIEVIVVKGDDNSVGGDVRIGLDVTKAETDSLRERFH